MPLKLGNLNILGLLLRLLVGSNGHEFDVGPRPLSGPVSMPLTVFRVSETLEASSQFGPIDFIFEGTRFPPLVFELKDALGKNEVQRA